jgi:hypothetical protein
VELIERLTGCVALGFGEGFGELIVHAYRNKTTK